MGCCGGSGSNSQVAYQATYLDGSVEKFTSSQEARDAIRRHGGGTLKVVPK